MSLIVDKIFENNTNQSALIAKDIVISYAQLSEQVNIACNRIQAFITTESSVLLTLNNSPTFVILLLALLKNKCKVYLYDNKATQAEILTIANFYEIPHVLSHFQSTALLDADDTIFLHTTQDKYQKCECGIVFFSSGTTHIPKAFFFDEKRLYYTFVLWAQYAQMSDTDNIFCPLSITHSHGIMLLLPPLMLGATCIIQHFEHVDTHLYLSIIEEYNVTVFSAVPYIYAHFIHNKDTRLDNIQTLRLCISGSAPLSKYVEEQFFTKYNIAISQGYGLSEIGPISINIFAHLTKGRNSVGKVIPHIEYKIIDEDGKEVAQGIEGELIVKSEWMATSYEKNPEATQEMYKKGWLHTQDIVKVDTEGFLYIVGRKSQFINIAGLKVHPSEVESVLLGIEGILEAWVYPIQDELKGQKIGAKLVTLSPLTDTMIFEYCAARLPKYKIPSTFTFVTEIQQNSIGKKIEKTC